MSPLYAILWIPYFSLLYFLYKTRSIYAPIFLMCCGVLNYRLPLYFGFEGKLFEAGLLFCLAISMMDFVIRPSDKKYDRLIWNGVLIYYLFVLISVLVRGQYDRLPTKIYRTIDYSLLFFMTIQCIKNKRDIRTLLKGVIFAVCIMGTLGLIGYAVNDPWWGQQVYDNPRIIEARNTSLPYYLQVRLSGQWEGRVTSTASNANALGTTMILVFPIAIFLWFSARGRLGKVLIGGAMAILILNLILSGSLTAIFTGMLVFWILFIGIASAAKAQIGFLRYLLGIILTALIILSVASSNYFSGRTYQRIVELQNIPRPMDAGGRMVRWKYALAKLDVTYLAIGRGEPGAAGTKGAHSNYLGIIYMGGIWSFIAFSVFFFRATKIALLMKDHIMGACFFALLIGYAVISIAITCAAHQGPGYVFWPVIAILANPLAVNSLPFSGKRLVQPSLRQRAEAIGPSVR